MPIPTSNNIEYMSSVFVLGGFRGPGCSTNRGAQGGDHHPRPPPCTPPPPQHRGCDHIPTWTMQPPHTGTVSLGRVSLSMCVHDNMLFYCQMFLFVRYYTFPCERTIIILSYLILSLYTPRYTVLSLVWQSVKVNKTKKELDSL